MQVALIGGVAAAVVVGLGVGWWLGAPPYRPMAANPNLPAFHQVKPGESDDPVVPGEDSAPGWKDRTALRDRAAAALNRFEQDPCDDPARQAFVDAWVARGHALAESGATPDGQTQPYWRTSADHDLDASVERLKREHFLTQDELNQAMLTSIPMARYLPRDPNFEPEQPLVLFQRCGRNNATPATIARLRALQRPTNGALARKPAAEGGYIRYQR